MNGKPEPSAIGGYVAEQEILHRLVLVVGRNAARCILREHSLRIGFGRIAEIERPEIRYFELLRDGAALLMALDRLGGECEVVVEPAWKGLPSGLRQKTSQDLLLGREEGLAIRIAAGKRLIAERVHQRIRKRHPAESPRGEAAAQRHAIRQHGLDPQIVENADRMGVPVLPHFACFCLRRLFRVGSLVAEQRFPCAAVLRVGGFDACRQPERHHGVEGQEIGIGILLTLVSDTRWVGMAIDGLDSVYLCTERLVVKLCRVLRRGSARSQHQ